jgi:hypothetical protein
MFNERWRPGSQITLVNNRDSADALLKLTVERSAGAQPETANVGVELINAGGKVIWTSPRGHYQGSPSEVSASIVRDLLAAIQRSKQRP